MKHLNFFVALIFSLFLSESFCHAGRVKQTCFKETSPTWLEETSRLTEKSETFIQLTCCKNFISETDMANILSTALSNDLENSAPTNYFPLLLTALECPYNCSNNGLISSTDFVWIAQRNQSLLTLLKLNIKDSVLSCLKQNYEFNSANEQSCIQCTKTSSIFISYLCDHHLCINCFEENYPSYMDQLFPELTTDEGAISLDGFGTDLNQRIQACQSALDSKDAEFGVTNYLASVTETTKIFQQCPYRGCNGIALDEMQPGILSFQSKIILTYTKNHSQKLLDFITHPDNKIALPQIVNEELFQFIYKLVIESLIEGCNEQLEKLESC